MHEKYHVPMLERLRDQQVRQGSRDKQIEQSARAERLLAELDPGKAYPYDFLYGRITDDRSASAPHTKISGQDARHDIRLFVEDLSDAADIPADQAGERVLTVDELSEAFNVSTKTIARWREQGLVSRRFVFDGRKKRVGFLQSSVDRFVRQNEDRVRRGAHFSQMSPNEKREIVEQARRMVAAGAGPAEVARRLAKRTGRSIETIRYTLKNHDQTEPSHAVFPTGAGLSDDAKRLIYQQYRRGTTVEQLAKRYNRNKASIYRVIGEMRAERIRELPLDFMPSNEFKLPGAERRILAPSASLSDMTSARKVKRPANLPPYLASLYEIPLLTREQEQYLFRKFNYLKYRASKLRDQLDPEHPKSALMDEIERYYEQAVATKNQIVRANLRLVVSIAKRHVGQADNFFELVSDGNMSLIRAAEKFDYSRGNKFSTYASWAIMKNFARTIPGELKIRDRFRTSQDDAFLAATEHRTDQAEEELQQARRQDQVNRILSRLDEREQKIIVSRFGLRTGQEPLTLKEVGEVMGVTKERVRQIEARALSKLRLAARDERIELPEE
jgi:RNA polymerase primary sigma factor/RNA polymerase sigma factor